MEKNIRKKEENRKRLEYTKRKRFREKRKKYYPLEYRKTL